MPKQPRPGIVAKIRESQKKERERWLIEEARRRSALFPDGELSEFESPDWVIRPAATAIEVSDLLPIRTGTRRFSPPQLSRFQEQVVQTAEQHYALMSRPAVSVSVYFHNDWNQQRDPDVMARALAIFVNRYRPPEKGIVLQRGTVDGYPEGLDIICIDSQPGPWWSNGAGEIPILRRDQVAAQIAAKDTLVKRYRNRLPGFEIWLLLTTQIRVHWSVWVTPEAYSWRFASKFDRVIISTWEGKVFEVS